MEEKSKKTNYVPISEFRKDIVSGDWILVATGRRARPGAEKIKSEPRIIPTTTDCPFEDPQKAGEVPVLWYANPNVGASEDLKDWFLQVIPNKYPILSPHHICPQRLFIGPYRKMDGLGFHEVVITRDHVRTLADMTNEEVNVVLRSYQERYLTIKNEKCIRYILTFHNYGEKAGASIFHPHSQIIALPIIPPDVKKSLRGSKEYFNKNKKCVHCAMLEFEEKENLRIVHESDLFIVIAPYAPRVSFEVRIYPKRHSAHFEDISKEERFELANVLRNALKKLKNVMGDPDYNFFIHTAPAEEEEIYHYHWHIEILPRTSSWAGLELGTGIEVVAVSPEESAEMLRKA